jgi:hypothetical protein
MEINILVLRNLNFEDKKWLCEVESIMFKKIAFHLVLAKWKRNVDALLAQFVLNIIHY